MEIYIVLPGDTIDSIARNHGITPYKLILDNGIDYSRNLVPGQALIIIYPTETYIVQEGDTLGSVAARYNITFLQLLRNNPFLYYREYIYPGETLVIRYNQQGSIVTNGYSYAFSRKDMLIQSLPYLTYLSVFNYSASSEGEIISYDDDTEMIQLAKSYGVAPLMMLTALTQRGEVNYDLLYELLLSDEYNSRLMDNIIKILRDKGFYGLNMLISNMNASNEQLYLSLFEKESKILKDEGFYFNITLNPQLALVDNQVVYEQLDYSAISRYVDGITILQYAWGTNPGPPAPVSSEYLLRSFIGDISAFVPSDKTIIGKPLIGYDWELPYVPGRSQALSLSIDRAVALAKEVGAEIQFDEMSKTPFFMYNTSYSGLPIEHMVWFIDIRSIDALTRIIDDFNLSGSGIWNIMIFYQQMWSLLNYKYDIVKLMPGHL
ncbi:MAG TPA: LysM peptidoglycan-binding domain-containing protein [Clostridiales bacterium]|nr:LysM peptidoglycan-binding domain-containing protein [Clostridiales bacterium]